MAEVAQKLAEYATGLDYENLPSEAVEKAKQLFLDVVGIALCASATADSTPAVRDTVFALGGAGEASLIGEEQTLHPAWAAFLNGCYAHSLDADDTHREGSIHPGAAIIPTLLALAEQNRLDGRRLLVAMIAGYDVTCKLAMAADPRSHYERGFHPTGTCGVFGATAAGAHLLGLSADALRNAFGINLSQSAGSLRARGEVFADRTWVVKGEPEAPLSWEELEAKFDGLAAARLPDAGRRRHLVEAIQGLDRLPDLRELGRLLRLEAAARVG